MIVTQVIVGPDQHGVVQFAHRIHDAVVGVGGDSVIDRHVNSPAPQGISTSDVVHLHVTDRLFGSPADRAAEAVSEVVAAVRATGARVVITLHDVPQPSDGRSFEVRTAAYRRIAELADVVVVSSDHERLLLAEVGIEHASLQVIPLPVATGRADQPTAPGPATVGVLGFLYPGKGHVEVAAALPPGAEFVALGRPSPGHEDLVDDLRAVSPSARVTGYVADDDLPAALHAVTVPVAHHRHLSASGSIVTWIEHGRRPLVVAGRYTREFEARSPGTVTIYEEGDLAEAVARAAADPASTWIDAGVLAHPTADEVGAAHVGAYRAALSAPAGAALRVTT
ncbi:Glycosyl transferase 4-like domain-containing protein [Rhodococcoides kroppenstedtii]|uniref:Glycosyl transferase 4-like domain-containing protein n=1 Tax=Rhodococcoides kroppenstedtii TaxID=293050 RepID=A0A1I0TK92_9NOCA|nr:glycosyltransferase [Rhodococcus kroppenstedtii]SFA52211.1 Glycosyl transferase 4-like domain-containing protein [Rhodococcus kroppenstedtii]